MKELHGNEMKLVLGGAKPPQEDIDSAKAALTCDYTRGPEGVNEPTGPTCAVCPGGTNDPEPPPGGHG